MDETIDYKDTNTIRVSKLKNRGSLLTEGGRIFRSCRRGEMSPSTMFRLLSGLKILNDFLPDDDLEHRVEILEKVSLINSGAN